MHNNAVCWKKQNKAYISDSQLPNKCREASNRCTYYSTECVMITIIHSPSWWRAITTDLAALSSLATCTNQPEASRRPNQLLLEVREGSLHATKEDMKQRGLVISVDDSNYEILPSTSLLRDVCNAPGASIL